jgi:hypothetical protein
MSEPIPLSAFPKFIDEESAHFLLLMAEKDLELEKCEKALNSLRKEIKNKRPNSAVSSARSLYDNIRKRLRDISQSTIGVEIEKKKPLESSFRETASKEYFKANHNYNEASGLREKIGNIHNIVKETTTTEIKRVTELYQINPGNAESVGLFHVIRCLVGDKVREFNKYTRSSTIGRPRASILINY